MRTEDKDEYFMEMVPHVHVGNGEWIPTDKVELKDISEDLQGYDLMTFVYQGKEMQSRVTNHPAY